MKPLVAALDAVLFDLDGTLVDTHIDFALMKREMMSLAMATGLPEDAVTGLDILGIARAAAAHVSATDGQAAADAIYSRAMSVLESIELRHAGNTEPVAYAGEAISLIREHGGRIGVVTRNCRKASELSLSIAGIIPEVLICREDCFNHKPHPEPVLLALEQLGAKPGNSIMVGDHIMDVQGGKAAGLATIGFLREDRPRDFFDCVKPDFVAYSLREVMSAIIDCDR